MSGLSDAAWLKEENTTSETCRWVHKLLRQVTFEQHAVFEPAHVVRAVLYQKKPTGGRFRAANPKSAQKVAVDTYPRCHRVVDVKNASQSIRYKSADLLLARSCRDKVRYRLRRQSLASLHVKDSLRTVTPGPISMFNSCFLLEYTTMLLSPRSRHRRKYVKVIEMANLPAKVEPAYSFRLASGRQHRYCSTW